MTTKRIGQLVQRLGDIVRKTSYKVILGQAFPNPTQFKVNVSYNRRQHDKEAIFGVEML